MGDPPPPPPYANQSNQIFTYFPGNNNIYAFSTIVGGTQNATQTFYKDNIGVNQITLGINEVSTLFQDQPVQTYELSVLNELLNWDRIALGSLVVCGSRLRGTENAQPITADTNSIFINNLSTNQLFTSTINGVPYSSQTVFTSSVTTNFISSGTAVIDSLYFNNLNGIPLTSPIFANPAYSTIYVTQGAQISSLTVTQRLAVSPSTTTQLGVVTTYPACSITSGANVITTTGSHTATSGSFTTTSGNFITTSGTVSSITMSARTLTISSINGQRPVFYQLPSTLVVPAISTIAISTAQLNVSSINSLPVLAYIPVTAYSATLLASSMTTSAVAIASTTITTNTPGNIIAIANVSAQALTNQYHNTYLNLSINNQVSPSTIFSAPAGTGHYGNGNISFRATVSTGTYTLVAYQSADSSGNVLTTSVNLTAMGNLN